MKAIAGKNRNKGDEESKRIMAGRVFCSPSGVNEIRKNMSTIFCNVIAVVVVGKLSTCTRYGKALLLSEIAEN